MGQVISLLAIKLADDQAERVRRSHHDAIGELQRGPFAGARIIKDVELVDGVQRTVPHGFGRPVVVLISPPRGAVTSGRVDEIRDAANDRSKYVTLVANDYGATVTVDLVVL